MEKGLRTQHKKTSIPMNVQHRPPPKPYKQEVAIDVKYGECKTKNEEQDYTSSGLAAVTGWWSSTSEDSLS